jgi:acetyl esterase/lipase
MNRLMVALFCLICAAGTRAATPNHPPGFLIPKPATILPVWPGTPPNWVAGGRAESVVNERFRDVSVPQLFVYLPPKEKANGTAVIICAGGGYNSLAVCLHVENVVKLFNEHGFAIFGLKYRTHYGTNDVVADGLADAQRAIRIVRSRASEWHIDPHRVGIQGYSAGANLCLNLAGQFDDGDAQATDEIERLSSRPDFCVLMSPWPNKLTIADFPLNRNSPPTWVASARDDKTAPFSFATAIAEKLKGLGVQEEFFTVDTGGHAAFHYGVVTGPGSEWPGPLIRWLEKIGMAGKSLK